MSEEQKAGTEAPAEEAAPGSELVDELHSLGRELATAVRALWDSDESRQLRTEIGDGFMELGRQVNGAIKSAQESEAGKQFSEQVMEAVDKARESDVAGKVEEGLVTGLRAMNQELSKLVTALQTQGVAKEEEPPEGEAAPQDESES